MDSITFLGEINYLSDRIKRYENCALEAYKINTNPLREKLEKLRKQVLTLIPNDHNSIYENLDKLDYRIYKLENPKDTSQLSFEKWQGSKFVSMIDMFDMQVEMNKRDMNTQRGLDDVISGINSLLNSSQAIDEGRLGIMSMSRNLKQ